MDERRLELKVGALLGIAVVGGLGLLYLLGQLSFGSAKHIFVDMSHSGGVPNGAPVKLAGVRVGRVKSLQLLPSRRDGDGQPLPVHMQVEIDEAVFKELRADVAFTVATQGPLGEPFLEITPGSANAAPLAENAELRAIDPPRMDLLAARLYNFLDAATQAIGDDPKAIHELFRNVAGLAAHTDAVLAENRPLVTSAIQDFADAARDLKVVAARANGLLATDGQASRVLGDMSVVAADLKRDLPGITEKAQKAMEGAASLAGSFTPQDVQQLKAAVARYEAAGQSLGVVAERADRILTRVENGEGTLGGLAKDPALYNDLKSFVSDLKRHPWKVFWKE